MQQLSRVGKEAAEATGTNLIEFAWSDAARAAALEARRAQAQGASGEGGHTEAAAYHNSQADYYDDEGESRLAGMHREAATAHTKAAETSKKARAGDSKAQFSEPFHRSSARAATRRTVGPDKIYEGALSARSRGANKQGVYPSSATEPYRKPFAGNER